MSGCLETEMENAARTSLLQQTYNSQDLAPMRKLPQVISTTMLV